ncbi:hypothetical protein H5410_002099, partial [Solanum commersonii]
SNNTYVGSLNVQGSVNDENTLASVRVNQPDSVSKILKEVPGNNKCSGPHAFIFETMSIFITFMTMHYSLWKLAHACSVGVSSCKTINSFRLTNVDTIQSASKPSPKDAFHEKQKYILAKVYFLACRRASEFSICIGLPDWLIRNHGLVVNLSRKNGHNKIRREMEVIKFEGSPQVNLISLKWMMKSF